MRFQMGSTQGFTIPGVKEEDVENDLKAHDTVLDSHDEICVSELGSTRATPRSQRG